jgi:hypothetical protein
MDVGKLQQLVDVIKRRGHALILQGHDVRAQWSSTAPLGCHQVSRGQPKQLEPRPLPYQVRQPRVDRRLHARQVSHQHEGHRTYFEAMNVVLGSVGVAASTRPEVADGSAQY